MRKGTTLAPARYQLASFVTCILYDMVQARDLQATKRGWPDFVVFGKSGLVCIEVKPHRSSTVKSTQYTVLRSLARYGVPSYVWSPSGGFEAVTWEGEFVRVPESVVFKGL